MSEDDAGPDLLDLAPVYALDAVDADERAAIETSVAAADPATADAFTATVAEIHETMALLAAADALTPPADLRERLLAALDRPAAPPVDLAAARARRRRTRTIAATAAAAVIVAVAGGVSAYELTRPSTPSISAQSAVASAPDAQTISAAVTGGGTATVQVSRDKNAAVLTMDGVPNPNAGSVYQIWLMPPTGSPASAGLITPGALPAAPGRVIEGIGDAAAIAFTVEPNGGSPQPTTTPISILKFS